MEHVEEAGVHSGDSACVIPPLSIGPDLEAEIRRQTEQLVRGLGVQGLCNVQFAIHEGTIYVLEANPRASRTVPFVCKAMGIDLVDLACRVTTGSTLAELNVHIPEPSVVAVKEVVLPFARFPGSDPVLGPEMRSTGEVMAIAPDFATTYAKAMRAAGLYLPKRPNGVRPVAFLSVCDRDKPAATLLAQRLTDLGFDLVATPGTARRIKQLGIEVTEVAKVGEEDGNSVVDLVRGGKVDLIVNTPVGRGAHADGYQIRRAAISARCRASRRWQRGAPCRRSRAWQVGQASGLPLDTRAWRPAAAGRMCRSAGAHVRCGRAGAVPHAACARARLAWLSRSPRWPPATPGVTFLCQPRPGARCTPQVGAEVEVLGPFAGFDASGRARPLLVGGDSARRCSPLAKTLPKAGLAPSETRTPRGRQARAVRGARIVPARQSAQLLAARLAAARTCSPPGPMASCAPSPPAWRRGAVPDRAGGADGRCGYGACYGCAVRLGGQLVRLCIEGQSCAAGASPRHERELATRVGALDSSIRDERVRHAGSTGCARGRAGVDRELALVVRKTNHAARARGRRAPRVCGSRAAYSARSPAQSGWAFADQC
jgi:hypothetical protein